MDIIKNHPDFRPRYTIPNGPLQELIHVDAIIGQEDWCVGFYICLVNHAYWLQEMYKQVNGL